MIREGGELRRVPPQPLHLEHGEDDPAVRGVRRDLPGGLQYLLELRADLDPGADLLAEDLVSVDAEVGDFQPRPRTRGSPALIQGRLHKKDEGALFQIANGFDLRHRNARQQGEYDGEFLDWILWWYLATVELTNRLIASRIPDTGS